MDESPCFAGATRAAVSKKHNQLLDRLLGQNSEHATRSFTHLLRNIIPVSDQPDPSEALSWIDPTSGHAVSVTRCHVIDYGFYIDDNRRVNPSTRATLGQQYYDDPSQLPATLGVPSSSTPVAPTTTVPTTTPGVRRSLEELLAGDKDPDEDVAVDALGEFDGSSGHPAK